LPISTGELLDGINYSNGSLQFSPEAGRHVIELIVEEARMHGSPTNIGINAMLRKLVRRLIIKGKLEANQLPTMMDSQIEHLLLREESTYEEYEQLLTESWRIRVTLEKPPVISETASLSKLYLAMPLVGEVSITETSPDILATIKELKQMLGTYYVWWEERSLSKTS
jgi:hypothetical protein